MDFKLERDAICAVSTPPGIGGVAVVRMTGKDSLSIAQKICVGLPQFVVERHMYLTKLISSDDGNAFDEALVCFFSEGRSYTGDETVEFFCHGGQMICHMLVSELVHLGCRVARPGEFTFRAYLSGKIDLVQVEGIHEMIHATSSAASRQFFKQMNGEFGARFRDLEDGIVWCLANLEASIDFVEDDLEVFDSQILLERLNELVKTCNGFLSSFHSGRLIREGVKVAIVGRPNVGKSSLLNAILGFEKSIVTEIPGTTRDLVEGYSAVNGVNVVFVDTAGIRKSEDLVEGIGIQRSKGAIEASDLVLIVCESFGADFLVENQLLELAGDRPYLIVSNKSDLNRESSLAMRSWISSKCIPTDAIVDVSCVENVGVSGLVDRIYQAIVPMVDVAGIHLCLPRQLELVVQCKKSILAAMRAFENELGPELVSFELQEAVRAVHGLVGKEFNEQVIDRIFKDFCIGK